MYVVIVTIIVVLPYILYGVVGEIEVAEKSKELALLEREEYYGVVLATCLPE